MPEAIHIAIVGPSGSGKTWLARNLAFALGSKALYLALDDFYRDLSLLRPEDRKAVNFDDPAAIDWDYVRKVMDALSARQSTETPNYDFSTHTRKPACRPLEPRDWVIWDGLWLLHEPWMRQRFSLSVFVDCTASDRLARRVARDVRERGRTPESVQRQFQDHVEPMSQRFVEPQRRWVACQVSSPVSQEVFNVLVGRVRNLTL